MANASASSGRSPPPRLLAAVLTAALATVTAAAPLGSRTLLISRQGSGGQALGTTNTVSTFLDELDSGSGNLLQSIAFNTSAAGTQCSSDSFDQHQGLVSSSGGFAYTTCYNVSAGQPISSSRRIIAVLAPNGTLDFSTALGYSSTAGPVTGVASPDGSHFWVGGFDTSAANVGRLLYTSRGSSNLSQQDASILVVSGGFRKPAIWNGQLYAVWYPTSPGYTRGVVAIGTGLPVGSTGSGWTSSSAVSYLPGLSGFTPYTGYQPTAFHFQDATTLWITDR